MSLYPRTVNVTMTEEHLTALKAARGTDRVPGAARLRALISICLEDQALGERVVRIARRDALTVDKSQGRRWTARMSLELTEQLHAALLERYLVDGVQVLGRIRAMIELWAGSQRLQQRVRHAAQDGVGQAR